MQDWLVLFSLREGFDIAVGQSAHCAGDFPIADTLDILVEGIKLVLDKSKPPEKLRVV